MTADAPGRRRQPPPRHGKEVDMVKIIVAIVVILLVLWLVRMFMARGRSGV